MSAKHRTVQWTRFVETQCVCDGVVLPSRALYMGAERMYVNNRYTVFVRNCGGEGEAELVHLSIKRNDRAPIHDWRDLQRIKNELVGPEAEGVELYPAESRKVDAANQFHLWVLVRGKFPFGFEERLVVGAEYDPRFPKAVQRPFEPGSPDEYAVSPEEYAARAAGRK